MRPAEVDHGGVFSGIEPDLFARMVGELAAADQTLQQEAAGLRSAFEWHGVDTRALAEIGAIAAWIESELPGLRRRQGLAQALKAAPGPGLVIVAEPLTWTSAQARDAGRALADRLNGVNRYDEAGAKATHDIAEELDQHKNDPDFTSAFYAELGESNRLELLPVLIASCGSKTGREDWRIFSEAFGTAVSARYPAPGLDAVKQKFTEPAPDMPAAWNRGAYLAYGKFPADWLAKTVRVNALDSFAEDPDQDWRGGGNLARELSLPENNIALHLMALGNNGEAARSAITYMGYPDHSHLRGENITTLLTFSGHDFLHEEALGRALRAGSGVDDELMGRHSPAAGAFALDTIVAVGNYKDGAPWGLKESMGQIAASYAPELLTGSRGGDGVSRRSGVQAPANFDALPGIDPAFYLSQADTYRFLKTFAERDDWSEPFDQAMGGLYQRTLREAAAVDMAAIRRGEQDPGNFEESMAAFGATAGLAYQAQLHVRGDMDEFDKKMRGIAKDLLTVGLIDRVPGGRLVGEVAWESAKFVAGKGLDVWVDDGESRVDRLDKKDFALAQATRYNTAVALMHAGWPLTTPPSEPFAHDGKLLPFGDLAKDEKTLNAFNDWLDENDSKDPHAVSFDEKGDDASGRFKGGHEGAREVAATVDPQED